MSNSKQSPVSPLEMHKIVFILLGVFVACGVSFPIAMWRVSRMESFPGFHVRSLTLEYLERETPVNPE